MSIEQSIPDARETLRSLFQAYFNERDMERTLAFLRRMRVLSTKIGMNRPITGTSLPFT